ncbi:zinc protease [Neisseria sp. HSC-16F19]|nr:pitrilysin family protein [Neisseria sp. HSC-16F19]MCP2041805.1 zinc protease [Neisseria sp. HSC-16F19]
MNTASARLPAPTLCLALALCLPLLPVHAETLSATLDNGMKVVVKEDKRAPVAVSQLWYRVGSQDEEPGKTGLSHALEHMMFKGTHTLAPGEFSRRVSSWGGNDNAYTSRQVTVYHQNIAAGRLPDVLAMEADRMVNLNFSDADFDNEMKVIREERRQTTDDNPQGKLWETLQATAYTRAHNQAPVIGHMADLHNLRAADLRQWYDRWYAPNNATLVIVGDVDARQTLETARRLFGPIAAKTLPERSRAAEPTAQTGKRAQTSAPSELPMLAIAYSAPKLKQLDDTLPYALAVLHDALAGDRTARLQKNWVRQNPLAVAVGADYELLGRSDGLFVLMGYPAQGVSVERLQAALEGEIATIARDGLSHRELRRVHTQAAADRIYAKDSMRTQANIIGTLENAGFEWTAEDEIQRRLQAVTVADIRAAARFLHAQQPAVVVLHPENPQTAGTE